MSVQAIAERVETDARLGLRPAFIVAGPECAAIVAVAAVEHRLTAIIVPGMTGWRVLSFVAALEFVVLRNAEAGL